MFGSRTGIGSCFFALRQKDQMQIPPTPISIVMSKSSIENGRTV